MATFNKFLQFVEEMAKKAHNLDTDTLKIALTNTAPTNTDTAFTPGSLHPPPAAANGYAAATIGSQDAEQTAGTMVLSGASVVFTATAGGIGPFRYAILYNDTHASDGLIGWWDYGSSITLLEDETLTIDFPDDILTNA